MQGRILYDQTFRKALAFDSLYWFAHIYFAHYLRYETADFHRQMYEDLQNDSLMFLEQLAFRGSAKTSISAVIFAIWSGAVRGDRNFILLAGETFAQAKQYIYNCRSEFEGNQLLINDWGPFGMSDEGDEEEWQKTTFVLSGSGCRYSAVSTGQNVRGFRQREHRPDLIIADDLESRKSVRMKANRDKLYDWFKSDLMQVGDRQTRIILNGNLLHSDGLMCRIEKEIQSGKLQGVVRRYRIVENGVVTWPGKYATMADVEKERANLGERTFRRESMLEIIPEEDQEVREEWIQRWNMGALKDAQKQMSAVGIDLAISKASTADFTTMVRAETWRMSDGSIKILILPHPIEQRLSFNETLNQAQAIAKMDSPTPMFFVEQVAYQQAAIEEMQRRLLPVTPVKITADKRARLRAITPYIEQGTVLFPERGTEDLETQLLGFGVEAHDDLVDAFVHVVTGLVSAGLSLQPVVFLDVE